MRLSYTKKKNPLLLNRIQFTLPVCSMEDRAARFSSHSRQRNTRSSVAYNEGGGSSFDLRLGRDCSLSLPCSLSKPTLVQIDALVTGRHVVDAEGMIQQHGEAIDHKVEVVGFMQAGQEVEQCVVVLSWPRRRSLGCSLAARNLQPVCRRCCVCCRRSAGGCSIRCSCCRC